jgi:RHS repeat-associated protein
VNAHQPGELNLDYDYDWLANQVAVERRRGCLLRALCRPYRRSGSDDPNFSASGDPAHAAECAVHQHEHPPAPQPPTTPGVPRGGYVTLDYGESGNVTQMIVHSQCVDVSNARRCADPRASSFTARRTALETNCRCAEEQRYVYDWDELNRVAEARRYERHGTGGWPLAVQQRYFYDAGNVRMVKETVDFGRVNEGASFNATTLYPYPGDYERRGVTLDFAGSTYNASPTLGTETQYLVGGARLVWASNQPGSGNLTREQRLTLPLSDLVQSTAAVVDLQSGELLEHTTFYPNGARETHRTTDEVSMQLEPVGFTGKEADEEVGLVYFGERYLIPRLGRWASVDPLSVHALGGGEALNGYHYVRGNLLQARDPLGLDSTEWDLFEGVVAGVLESGMAALDSATDLEGAVEAVKQYAEAVETAYDRGGVVAALEEGNPILRSTRAVQEEVAAAEAAIERGDATAVGESLGRVLTAAAPFIPRRRGGRPRPRGDADAHHDARIEGPADADGTTPDGSPSTEPAHPPPQGPEDLAAARDAQRDIAASEGVTDTHVGTVPRAANPRQTVPDSELDPQQTFTREQRQEMVDRQGERCPGCGREVTVDDTDAHHVVPRANGGRTVVGNGVALCRGRDGCHTEVHRPPPSERGDGGEEN